MLTSGALLGDLKSIFSKELSEQYSTSEISLMVKFFAEKHLSISTSDFLLSKNVELSDNQISDLNTVVERLKANEPFQYVLGEVEFYGLELVSDRRALIPRPETEELVDWIVDLYKDGNSTILDLCSGSGCIALAMKSRLKNSAITGVELSGDALELCEVNKVKTKLDVAFKKLNVLVPEDYSFGESSFDCWVSNPPYVLESDKAFMQSLVLDHEPSMALFVEDEDPLLFYRVIAQQALIYLKDEGMLFFEIHEEKGQDMHVLLESLGFVNIELRKDLQGRPRMMKAQKRTFTL